LPFSSERGSQNFVSLVFRVGDFCQAALHEDSPRLVCDGEILLALRRW